MHSSSLAVVEDGDDPMPHAPPVAALPFAVTPAA